MKNIYRVTFQDRKTGEKNFVHSYGKNVHEAYENARTFLLENYTGEGKEILSVQKVTVLGDKEEQKNGDDK